MKTGWRCLLVVTGLVGCDGGLESTDRATTHVSALTSALAPDADTFINSMVPDNNNGTSPSIYTGVTGQGGMLRGLVRFAIPAALQGHITVSRVSLTMVTRGLSMTDMKPPRPATESLQAITVDWSEGAGFGDGPTTNTIGQACGTTGATWNQPNCAGGTDWAGGAVAAAVSATASVPMAVEATVTWDSADSGNAGLVTDVQSWIDAPAGNHGWRMTSSTGTAGDAQRFYAREAAGMGPGLTITYECNAGDTCGDQSDAGTDAPAADAGGPGTDGGGCSCALADASGRPRAGLFVVAVAAVGVGRRRRRR